MLLISVVKDIFDRRCKGTGDFTLSPLRDESFDQPEPSYVAICPKCGKAKPCTGRGVLMEHNR